MLKQYHGLMNNLLHIKSIQHDILCLDQELILTKLDILLILTEQLIE